MRAALYTARWVLPVTSAPIRDGAVLVNERGIIEHVGPQSDRVDNADVVDLGDAILLPGLVNVHAHFELTGMRGLLEDLPFHQWIPTLKRIRDDSHIDDADLDASARWTALECMAAGVTTVGATENSDAAVAALRDAGMRGIVFREVFGPAPERARDAIRDLERKVSDMQRHATDLVRIGVSPHAPYTVSDDLFRAVAEYTRAENLPVAVHAAESEAEKLLVTEATGPFAAGLRTRGIATAPRARSTIALLEETGILAAKPLLIHCVTVSAEDAGRIAACGASVAHCPTANARLGHGIAPAVELIEAGVTVGIGSDSVASNNRIDLLEEARTAQMMQRARLRSAGALDAARLLRLLTIDGARALGMDSRIGSIEPGKAADLCAVRIDTVHARPVHDPLATLLFAARGTDVILTVVEGRPLYRNGMFLTIDPESIRARFEESAARLSAAREAN